MREVERDRDAGHAVGREPLVRQPEVRPERAGRARRARAGARRSVPRAALPSMVTPSSQMRRSSSFSSGQVGPLLRRHDGRLRRRGRRVGARRWTSRAVYAESSRARREMARASIAGARVYGSRGAVVYRSAGARMARALVRSPWFCSDVRARACSTSHWPMQPGRSSLAAAGIAASDPPSASTSAADGRADAGRQPPSRPARPETRRTRRSTKRRSSSARRRREEKLINAPATMSVITSRRRSQNAPSQNFAELLRTVPGVNITQVSARDINVTSRGATGTLATGQLALLDGRSLYQDFFGFVMWDFLPVNLERGEADRSHPRTGIGGLGRQRALRRRQRHHEVAARDAGHDGESSASAASIAAISDGRRARSGT